MRVPTGVCALWLGPGLTAQEVPCGHSTSEASSGANWAVMAAAPACPALASPSSAPQRLDANSSATTGTKKAVYAWVYDSPAFTSGLRLHVHRLCVPPGHPDSLSACLSPWALWRPRWWRRWVLSCHGLGDPGFTADPCTGSFTALGAPGAPAAIDCAPLQGTGAPDDRQDVYGSAGALTGLEPHVPVFPDSHQGCVSWQTV